MKGNKKYLVLALLLLLIAVSFGTYAIYKSSALGSATASAATWAIEVNDTNIVATDSFTLDSIAWDENEHVATGKIAPGSTGTVDLEIDATGTEVSVHYEVTVDSVQVNGTDVDPSTISVTADTGSSLTGDILLSAANKKVTVPLKIEWVGIDSTTQNPIDLGIAGKNITVSISVVVSQKLS